MCDVGEWVCWCVCWCVCLWCGRSVYVHGGLHMYGCVTCVWWVFVVDVLLLLMMMCGLCVYHACLFHVHAPLVFPPEPQYPPHRWRDIVLPATGYASFADMRAGINKELGRTWGQSQ